MKENGFEYVDLDLPSGTMWATCNVGAAKPEDSGLLFQFGQVDGYTYNDNNNKFIQNYQNEKVTGSEYIPVTTSGKVYKANDILDLEDDAAHVNMGGEWKMPTNYQLEELFYCTTHKLETVNGVKGMMFTSDINGNQLFIPFAGWWYDDMFEFTGSCGVMLSSQVYNSDVDYAYILSCVSSGYTNIGRSLRSRAFSVRGVFKKIKHLEAF